MSRIESAPSQEWDLLTWRQLCPQRGGEMHASQHQWALGSLVVMPWSPSNMLITQQPRKLADRGWGYSPNTSTHLPDSYIFFIKNEYISFLDFVFMVEIFCRSQLRTTYPQSYSIEKSYFSQMCLPSRVLLQIGPCVIWQ